MLPLVDHLFRLFRPDGLGTIAPSAHHVGRLGRNARIGQFYNAYSRWTRAVPPGCSPALGPDRGARPPEGNKTNSIHSASEAKARGSRVDGFKQAAGNDEVVKSAWRARKRAMNVVVPKVRKELKASTSGILP